MGGGGGVSCHRAATWAVSWHGARWFVCWDEWHLCHLCRLCHHDTKGGGGHRVCRDTYRDMGKLPRFLSPEECLC